MESVVKMVIDYGVTVVIIAMFIYTWWQDNTKNKAMMENSQKLGELNNGILIEMRNTNENTSKSLELLSKSMESQDQFSKEHDRKCDLIVDQIKDIIAEILKK